ncbi:MAG: heavy-metal-associated domain-containing protein [Nitrospiria bacterium]
MHKSKITIEGMTCNHCVETVTKALEGLSGVSDVSVILEENCANLSYDAAKVELSEIKKAVEETGFDVLKVS